MGKRELVALLNLSSWCLVMVERLFLVVPRGCLRFVIVVFPGHTHLLFWIQVRIDHRFGLMWAQTDCKNYPIAKLITSMERVTGNLKVRAGNMSKVKIRQLLEIIYKDNFISK